MEKINMKTALLGGLVAGLVVNIGEFILNGPGIEDRQILLAHASSQATKVYTHPNFELAWEYVNRMPNPQVGNTLIQR